MCVCVVDRLPSRTVPLPGALLKTSGDNDAPIQETQTEAALHWLEQAQNLALPGSHAHPCVRSSNGRFCPRRHAQTNLLRSGSKSVAPTGLPVRAGAHVGRHRDTVASVPRIVVSSRARKGVCHAHAQSLCQRAPVPRSLARHKYAARSDPRHDRPVWARKGIEIRDAFTSLLSREDRQILISAPHIQGWKGRLRSRERKRMAPAEIVGHFLFNARSQTRSRRRCPVHLASISTGGVAHDAINVTNQVIHCFER